MAEEAAIYNSKDFQNNFAADFNYLKEVLCITVFLSVWFTENAKGKK